MSGLRVDFDGDASALARFAFAAVHDADDAWRVHCPRLAGPEAPERWSAPTGDDTECMFVRIELDADDIAAATDAAYRRLLVEVRGSAHPWLLRVWNYFDRINEGEGDAERYRRFCVGRAAAVDAQFNAPPPAATAIGHPHRTGRLQLMALCTRTPGIALENPRQTPAWQYPREYGPVAPGFSRGALLGAGEGMRLLASGTASIVGHVSQHPGDVVAQLEESLRNLSALLDEGTRRSDRGFSLRRHEALRVYLRHADDLEKAQTALAAHLPLERVVFLHGDICRRELLVELEGAFAPD